MVWADLKRYVRDKCPRSLYAMIRCIRKFEKKRNSRYYKRYADHTINVLDMLYYVMANGQTCSRFILGYRKLEHFLNNEFKT